ncbi:MAG: amidase [Pseudomonas sp.]|uniref:amidase n=1 Tax=Pseudomonas sp. TaxID=306 RepID=UPI0012020F32|nr:amidase [Pseudomonas sp.]RZI69940.1 MAG: amidase [Pseudomonas sp.]
MNARMAFIRRRPFRSFFILVLLIIAGLIWDWRVQLQVFPSIISAYTAKEYCSCRFVMDNPANYCRRYVKQWLPSTLDEDALNKRITATGLGRESAAQWEGPRQGCRLSPPVP